MQSKTIILGLDIYSYMEWDPLPQAGKILLWTFWNTP